MQSNVGDWKRTAKVKHAVKEKQSFRNRIGEVEGHPAPGRHMYVCQELGA
jgi:hypothetical protein